MELSKEVRIYYSNSLRSFRHMAGLTQQQVAKKLGLKGTSKISKWESGHKLPSVKNLFRLSILYGRLADDLYFEYRMELMVEMIKDNDSKAE